MAVPKPADIVVINYELVARHEGSIRRVAPRALIVDESHYCKNPQAKRTLHNSTGAVDPLGDHAETERVTETDDGGADSSTGPVTVEINDPV